MTTQALTPSQLNAGISAANFFFPHWKKVNTSKVLVLDDFSDTCEATAWLFYAVRFSGLRTIEEAIKHGADINYQNAIGETPLHFLAQSKAKVRHKGKMVKLLLDNGANPNLQDWKGNTPLHYCSVPEVVKVLIEGGADSLVTNYKGFTPVDTISHTGDYELALALWKYEIGRDVPLASKQQKPAQHI